MYSPTAPSPHRPVQSDGHAHAHNQPSDLDHDPTQTQPIRARYTTALHDALDAIADWIRERVARRGVPAENSAAQAFLAALRTQVRDQYLGVVSGRRNPYIRRGYELGAEQAYDSLADEGVDVQQSPSEALRMPRHQRERNRLRERNQSLLEAIGTDMGTAWASIVTTAVAGGWAAGTLIDELVDRLDAIGRWRSTLVGITEVINAHALAALNVFESVGVGRVTVAAEFVTQDDDRVCPICEALAGTVMSIDEARTGSFEFEGDTYQKRPPIHPMCRCLIVPVLE